MVIYHGRIRKKIIINKHKYLVYIQLTNQTCFFCLKTNSQLEPWDKTNSPKDDHLRSNLFSVKGSMAVSGSPERWEGLYNPPIGSIYHLYTTYILPSGGLYIPYHLLGEPETAIERTIKGQNINLVILLVAFFGMLIRDPLKCLKSWSWPTQRDV